MKPDELQYIDAHYAVSRDGVVWSTNRRFKDRTPKPMKPSVDGYGYAYVRPYINGAQKRVYVHRAVALMFVDGKSDECYIVNHKDGNKLNNNADNLEWCTPKDNVQHAIALGLR